MGFKSPLFLLGLGSVPPDVPAEGGFKAPLFLLGLGGTSDAVPAEGGFKSPLFLLGLGSVSPLAPPPVGGFRTPLPFWNAGAISLIQLPSDGGGGSAPVIGTRFNQAPSVKNNEPLLLAQALQEDEELLIILKAFVETIRWH